MNNTHVDYPFKTDHDVMIALISDFNAAIASIDKQISQDHTTTLEVKQLLEQQYQSLAGRIEALEQDLLKLDPKQIALLTDKVQKHEEWIASFNTAKHMAWVIASTGFLAIGYFLPLLIKTLTDMFRFHN